jgi:hypothetical protein
MAKFVFTRYLYEKDEVKLSLLISILKRKDDAVFWAYELYYSGFKEELKTLLWTIYYDFFATLNPAFNIYLLKQFKEKWEKEDKIVAQLVENFMTRPFNLDVFMIRNQVKIFEIEKDVFTDYDYLFNIKDNDYAKISSYILDDILPTNLEIFLEEAINYFERKGLKINKKKIICDYNKMKNGNIYCPRIILLAQILHLYSLENKRKMGKNLYVSVDHDSVVMYETITNGMRVYRILETACICEIDAYNYISLFSLKREHNDIRDAYLNKWLYYASDSPFWKEKIEKYRGIKNDEKREIQFNEDNDDFDDFYNLYNYEPDEQKKRTQDKSIKVLQNDRTWKSFYIENKGNGIINIEDEFLEEFGKIIYF